MLEARNLSRHAGGERLFAGVSFTLQGGQTRVLFGPSGSGKTTLIRILAGFTDADSGDVRLDGRTQRDVPPREWRRNVVLLHQQPRMFPGTVRDNLEFAARYHDLEVQPARLLDQCQLDVGLERDASTLSGGEQKRLSLARALSIRPRFLLLDEPTASVHRKAREAIDELLLRLVEEQNLGTLWVTHNREEVRKLGTRGFALVDGSWRDLKPSELESLP